MALDLKYPHLGHFSLQRFSSNVAPQFGQVRSIFSRSGLVLEVTVVMRFIVLLFLPEILGQVAQNRCRIGRTSLKSGDATGPAPAGAALNTDDDVLVEKAAILQKANGRFRGEFV